MENFKNINNYIITKNDDKDEIFDIDDKIVDNKNGQNVYQLQSSKNSEYCYLMLVGKANNKPGILIKEFNYTKNISCKIMSIMYLQNDLNTIDLNNEIKIINFILYKQKKVIGILQMDFFTYDHTKAKCSINELLSVKTDKSSVLHELHGFYKYSFIYEKDNMSKKLLLKTLKSFPGNQSMIDIGVNLLYDIEISLLLNN
jgi:hypothetical protein